MITAPPGPVYPVIVRAPLLVVKVNWACTTPGSAKSITNSDMPMRQRRPTWMQHEWQGIGLGKDSLAPQYGLAFTVAMRSTSLVPCRLGLDAIITLIA